jgi:von Willebrand factor type A domain
MQEISSFIQWHDHEMFPVEIDCDHPPSLSKKFGILHIDIPKVPMYKGTIAILFNIDKSGSMKDICSDHSTKIQHIQHALKNFLSVLIQTIKHHPDITVRIGICVFSHDAHNLFHMIHDANTASSCDEFGFITIHSDNIHSIYKKIDDIDPWGLTNIEKSLKYAQTCFQEYHDANPDHRLIHIQFTDGDATVGKKKYQDLMEFVDHKYKHVFVGVGDEHDSYLLTNISQNTYLGEYRFIDQLNHAGLICGEILYDILFPYALYDDPIHLIAKDGVKIYDWRINQWTTSLIIPPFSGNRCKDFQLCFENEYGQEDTTIDIYNNMMHLDTAVVLPRLIDQENHTLIPNDLTHFILKQYTQEYLYEAIQYELIFRADIPVLQRDESRCGAVDPYEQKYTNEQHIRDKLTHFNTILQRYQDKYHQNESFQKFVQVLKDDIRITLKNLGTQLGFLYSTTRQTSQGNQYSYTPTGEENITSDKPTNFPGSLERNITSYTNPHILDMMSQIDVGDFDNVREARDIEILTKPEDLSTEKYDDYYRLPKEPPSPIQRGSSKNTFEF